MRMRRENDEINEIFRMARARSSDKKDLEIVYLRDQISLTFKDGKTNIDGRLKAIDSKNPVIEISGTRCRTDVFNKNIKIMRPENDLPYLEVRR